MSVGCSYRRFEGFYCLHFHGLTVNRICLVLKMKILELLDTSESTRPKALRYFLGDFNLHCLSLKNKYYSTCGGQNSKESI